MKFTIPRRTSQIIFLILAIGGFTGFTAMHLINPFLHCYACPFATAACPVGILQRFITLGEIPWYPLGAIAIYGLLLGRAFCGWACPFGLMQDMADKVNKRKLKISRPIHQKATMVKFVGVAVIVLAAWWASDVLFCKICPAGTLEASIPYYIQNGLTVTAFFIGKISLFIVILASIFLISRSWCRYLCPFGAILAPFNKTSLVHVEVDSEKCTDCGVCKSACPMNIEVTKDRKSLECIKCGKCIDSCPSDALYFKIMPSLKKIKCNRTGENENNIPTN